MVFLMAPRGALSRSLRKSHEGGRGIDRGVGPLVPRHTTRGASRRSSNDAGRRVSSVMSCVAHRGHRARHAPTLAEAARAVNTKRCTRRRRHGRRVSCGARSKARGTPRIAIRRRVVARDLDAVDVAPGRKGSRLGGGAAPPSGAQRGSRR